jgi:hypothetical protein
MQASSITILPWKQNPKTEKVCHKPSSACIAGRKNCIDCDKIKGSKSLTKSKGYIPKFKKILEETD